MPTIRRVLSAWQFFVGYAAIDFFSRLLLQDAAPSVGNRVGNPPSGPMRTDAAVAKLYPRSDLRLMNERFGRLERARFCEIVVHRAGASELTLAFPDFQRWTLSIRTSAGCLFVGQPAVAGR